MALSDCPKCWDTPCTCGHYWRDFSNEAKIKQAKAILGDIKIYFEEDMDNAYDKGFKDGTKKQAI
jgi:hypothetical protein